LVKISAEQRGCGSIQNTLSFYLPTLRTNKNPRSMNNLLKKTEMSEFGFVLHHKIGS